MRQALSDISPLLKLSTLGISIFDYLLLVRPYIPNSKSGLSIILLNYS